MSQLTRAANIFCYLWGCRLKVKLLKIRGGADQRDEETTP
jgi:hypothetical protein